VQALLDEKGRDGYINQIADEYERLREHFRASQQKVELLSLEEARSCKPQYDWNAIPLEKPEFTGIRVLDDYPLDEIAGYIDWSPLFHAWDLKGVYPRILEDPKYGERARAVFADAQRMLDRIIKEKLLRARAVCAIWPANSVGDDVEVYTDESRSKVLGRFHFLRQQT